MLRTSAIAALLLSFVPLHADGPKDNIPENVRRVPPPGIMVPEKDRKELQKGLDELDLAILDIHLAAKRTPAFAEFLPDVEVYRQAVHYALNKDEFFNAREIAVARNLLKTGKERAAALLDGKHPWTRQMGLVVRGYRSKIDGSAQPYGLVIPKDFDFQKKIRLDFWCHGRGETLSELNFIQSCQSSPGQFASDKAIVLNLYGRYCCANKFAGEIDCLEALDAVKKQYPIDESRLVMRGFSMGGAACWQFAVHYPSLWCAAAPGAGFSETADFLKVFQNEPVQPTWYEKKLWHWYDCTDYALNLFNLPTVAYSGEIDKQKQAADMMAKAMKAEGLTLTHIIGPKTAHAYEKGAKAEVIRLVDAIADKGKPAVPTHVKFVTYFLRYNRSYWVRVTALDQHWERAQVDAEIIGKDAVKVTTKNVRGLVLDFPASASPFEPGQQMKLTIDGSDVGVPPAGADKTWAIPLRKENDKWGLDQVSRQHGLEKQPGLQGPIDDAFLDSFVMVKPTGKPLNDKAAKWADAEMQHAVDHWRRQFRGDAPVKNDTAISAADIASSNLVLWGDPSSNAILGKIADKLPIKWTSDGVQVGTMRFESGHHVPVLIYPNPLNPTKYIVINSGFTFREYDYLNNARQIPKLPDFAVIDIDSLVTSRAPGKVVTAGFFDEKWQLPAQK